MMQLTNNSYLGPLRKGLMSTPYLLYPAGSYLALGLVLGGSLLALYSHERYKKQEVKCLVKLSNINPCKSNP
jgi:hypothetical protein